MTWPAEFLPFVDLFSSVLLALGVMVAAWLINRFVRRRAGMEPHAQRRWVANVRNAAWFLLVVGLVLIWAPQLRTFALSLTAVAVAIVVATKELILCVSGAVLRASARAFSVGDWIEVAGSRGEVVDHTLFATTLHELDGAHHTGRTIVVPNSMLLTAPVRNLSHLRTFTFHTFAVTIDPAIDVTSTEDALRAVAERHVAPFAAEAARVNALIERRTGSDIREPELRLRFSTTDLGKYRVTFSLFVPVAEAEPIEAAVTREAMQILHGRVLAAKAAEKAAS